MRALKKEFDINTLILQHQNSQSVSTLNRETEEQHQDSFTDAVKKVRTILHQPKGKTEEERLEYTQTLNRAVLGYPKERAKFMAYVEDIIRTEKIQSSLPEDLPYRSLTEAIFSETVGLKLLEQLLHEREEVEEIQVVGTSVFEVIDGISHPTPLQFPRLKDVENLQNNLVLYSNDRLDDTKPYAEVIMEDGSRVSMQRPPLTSEPTITIRKYRMRHFSLDHLVEIGSIHPRMKRILQSFIDGRCNMVVMGDTGTGKTTILKTFIASMNPHHRLVTIESDFELFIRRDFPHLNVVEFQFLIHYSIDGKVIFKISLRLTPTRIIMAEVRAEDVIEFIKAATRGHDGSITTVHGTDLEDIPEIMAEMALESGRNLDYTSLVRRIAKRVVDIGIKLELVQDENGNLVRKVTQIAELDYEEEEGVVVRNLCVYDHFHHHWVFPDQISPKLGRKIFRFDRLAFHTLVEEGVLDSVCIKQYS